MDVTGFTGWVQQKELQKCTCFCSHHSSNGGPLQKAILNCKGVVHVVHALYCLPHVVIAEQITHNHLCNTDP